MWDLFGSFERGVIIEVGELLNVIANLDTFGVAILEQQTLDRHTDSFFALDLDILGMGWLMRGLKLVVKTLVETLTRNSVAAHLERVEIRKTLNVLMERPEFEDIPDPPTAEGDDTTEEPAPLPAMRPGDKAKVAAWADKAKNILWAHQVIWNGARSTLIASGMSEDGVTFQSLQLSLAWDNQKLILNLMEGY